MVDTVGTVTQQPHPKNIRSWETRIIGYFCLAQISYFLADKTQVLTTV
jgi:hypothetical protein